MSYPMPTPRNNGYRASIEIIAAAGEDAQGLGSIVALLHITAHDCLVLRQHQIVGKTCKHEGTSMYEDEKEITKRLAEVL